MKLSEKRCLFTRLITEHVQWLISTGQRVALDEGMDRLTKKDPTSDHMKGSLHDEGLAQDLVFYDEKWKPMELTEHHRVSGEMWETRHPLCCWGGRFGDGCHYSVSNRGRK